MPNPSSSCFTLPRQQSESCRARDVRLGISSKLRRNLARHIMVSWCGIGATRRGPGGWRGRRPSILFLFPWRALHSGPAQCKIRWCSPTTIRLSRGQDAAYVGRVQGERQRALPTLRQLPWPCDPGATNGSLLWPVASISPRINKADVTMREMLDSAFRQNFDDIVPGI